MGAKERWAALTKQQRNRVLAVLRSERSIWQETARQYGGETMRVESYFRDAISILNMAQKEGKAAKS